MIDLKWENLNKIIIRTNDGFVLMVNAWTIFFGSRLVRQLSCFLCLYFSLFSLLALIGLNPYGLKFWVVGKKKKKILILIIYKRKNIININNIQTLKHTHTIERQRLERSWDFKSKVKRRNYFSLFGENFKIRVLFQNIFLLLKIQLLFWFHKEKERINMLAYK